jgi:hypothetical protein
MAHAHTAHANDAFGKLVAGGGEARPTEYMTGHYAECRQGRGRILEEFPPVGKVFFLHGVYVFCIKQTPLSRVGEAKKYHG